MRRARVLLILCLFLAGTRPCPCQASDPFAPGVGVALGRMGASSAELLLWGDEIPGSCLSAFWAWPAARQQETARLALYIHGINPALTSRACWRMAGAFVVASMRFWVPLDLAVAVAQAESGFNPAAQSPAGATGVMQVMPDIHKDLLAARFDSRESWALVDPEKAVLAGSFLLAGYLREEGSVEGALARYLGAFNETYRDRVMRFRAGIRASLFR